jgi:hypothetical protein
LWLFLDSSACPTGYSLIDVVANDSMCCPVDAAADSSLEGSLDGTAEASSAAGDAEPDVVGEGAVDGGANAHE